MKKQHAINIIIATLLTSPVYATDWDGQMSLLFSHKALEKEWNEHDSQDGAGIMTDFKMSHWPVSIAVDVHGAVEDKRKGNLVETVTGEVDLGVRKIWNLNSIPLRPYLGGGLAFIGAEQRRTNDQKQEDDTVGGWVNAGTYWDVSDRMNLGLDVRYSHGEVNLYNEDLQAGGLTAGVTVGFHW